MITLRKLTWSNCFSYGPDNCIQLDDAVVTQIIGTNGMGKSSIPLIIEEALFNKNSKGVKKADIPNRHINAGYHINLEFTKNEDSYVVDVTRSKSKLSVMLFCNDEDISSHTATNTYKTLLGILGSEFKTFSQLVYQSTNASLQFLSATDTNRKKFLIDLLHLENYLELLEVFKEAHKEFTNETTGIKATVATIEKWMENNILSDTNIQDLLLIEENTEEAEKELRQLNEEIANIQNSNKKIQQNEEYKKQLASIDLTKFDMAGKETQSYDEHQKVLGESYAAMNTQKGLLAKLKKLGDNCPTCEQAIDSAFKEGLINESILSYEENSEKHGRAERAIEQIRGTNKEVEHYQQAERDWQSLYASVDNDLATSVLDKGSLERRAVHVQNCIQDAKNRIHKVIKENQQRTERNTRITVILEQTAAFEQELEEALAVLHGQDEVLANLAVLKKAFSTNGILAYKIENLVKELEELSNTYLAELSDGRFTLEFVVSNDKLNVQITDDSNVVDITALSSGELARVNTATLIAIRKLMSSISKSRINVLFLDEVIAVLDDTGREKLVEVLLNEENLNTFIVSHEWEHPLLAKLSITKKDDISIIEV